MAIELELEPVLAVVRVQHQKANSAGTVQQALILTVLDVLSPLKVAT